MFVGVANYCAQGQLELMDEVFFPARTAQQLEN